MNIVNLLKKYNIGFNIKLGDYRDLANKIIYLTNNSKLRFEMGKNNRLMTEKNFLIVI